MRRSFYSFGIFLSVLMATMAGVEALLYALLDNRIQYMDFYNDWLFGTVVFSLASVVYLLRYFRMKGYRAAFVVGIVQSSAMIVSLFSNFLMMTFGIARTVAVPAYLLALLTTVVFGAVLFFSKSRERFWLRMAGACQMLLGFVSCVVIMMILSGQFIGIHGTLEKFHGWILLGVVFTPVLQALNFGQELRSIPREPGDPSMEGFYAFGKLIALVACFYFCISYGWQGYRMMGWIPGIDAAVAKVAEPFEARSYVDGSGDTLKYRLLKPLDYDPSKRYPIVTCLHGSSGTGNDNVRQVAASLLPEFLANDSNRKNFQAFIFVPQCKFGTSWGGIHPLPAMDKIVFETMRVLEREFSIDTARRYVGGVSLGGYGSWHFIATKPDMFAAAVPICGAGDPDLASKSVNVPVWAFHGEKDERVPVTGSRYMIDALQKAGGAPRYTEFPGAGHNIGKLVCDTPGLLDWMFSQNRAKQ